MQDGLSAKPEPTAKKRGRASIVDNLTGKRTPSKKAGVHRKKNHSSHEGIVYHSVFDFVCLASKTAMFSLCLRTSPW